MAEHSAGRFELLRYDPGNPEFPTLPDGVDSLHVIEIGRAPALEIPRPIPDELLERNSAPDTEGFADWFLDGIWRQPNPVDFGNITAAKQRLVTVHNTSRSAVTLTAVDLTAVSGVSLVSPGLPIGIDAFDTVTLTFEAAVSGDASFDAEAVLTVDGATLPIRMIGRRVVIFDTLPEMPIIERLSWLTDNMVAVDGTEQAFSLRRTPRSRVTINQRLDDDVERTRQQNLILGAGFLRQGVQLWWQARRVSAAALSTDTVIQVDTTNMELQDGDDVSLYFPDGTTTEVEAQTLTPTSMTLNQAVGVAVPLGTHVMPLKFGFQNPTAKFGAFAQNLEDSQIIFDLIEYDDIGALDLAYFDTHPVDGLPIITHPLEFTGRQRPGELTQRLSTLDGKTGDIGKFRNELLARWGQDVLVNCRSMAEQHAWRRFLHFIRGSWREFYVPTGTNDLPLAASLSLGGNTFTIPSMGVESLINNVAPRRDVWIEENGNVHYRRVSSVSDNGTTELVTVDSAIPGSGSVPVDQVKISWLTLSRLAGDTATFRHRYLGEAELRFSTRGVIKT